MNAEHVASLRLLADFLEANPDVVPGIDWDSCIYSDTKEGIADKARRFSPVEKEFTDHHFGLVKHFGSHATLRWFTNRSEVCERVVVGTKTVTRPVMVQQGEETVEVEIKEWRCVEPLLKPTVRVRPTESLGVAEPLQIEDARPF